MPGPPLPGEPPPEVPEEFADVYRAAYERALAEQSVGARHVAADDHDDLPDAEDDISADDEWAYRLPRRTGSLRSGSHRDQRPEEAWDEDEPGALDRLRESRWFVPALLVLIALLLLAAAYLGGRIFAETVVNVESGGADRTSGAAVSVQAPAPTADGPSPSAAAVPCVRT